MSSEEPNAKPQEADEPAAGSQPTPIWMLVALGCLIYVATMYLDYNAGGFNAEVYAPYRSVAEVQQLQPGDEGKLLQLGSQVYNNCAACHQSHGRGQTGLAPPLRGSEWVTVPEPDRLIRIVLHGLTGEIEVAGETWDMMMPGWENQLSDEEIAAVLTYIRQHPDWDHDAPAVSTEEVEAVRNEHSGRTQPWTADELEEIPVSENDSQ